MDELQGSFESILQNLHIILEQRESQVCPTSVKCLQEVKYFRNQTCQEKSDTCQDDKYIATGFVLFDLDCVRRLKNSHVR